MVPPKFKSRKLFIIRLSWGKYTTAGRKSKSEKSASKRGGRILTLPPAASPRQSGARIPRIIRGLNPRTDSVVTPCVPTCYEFRFIERRRRGSGCWGHSFRLSFVRGWPRDGRCAAIHEQKGELIFIVLVTPGGAALARGYFLAVPARTADRLAALACPASA